jgi:hypothetical protein
MIAVESDDTRAAGAVLATPEVAWTAEAVELALPAPTTAVGSGDARATGAMLDALNGFDAPAVAPR